MKVCDRNSGQTAKGSGGILFRRIFRYLGAKGERLILVQNHALKLGPIVQARINKDVCRQSAGIISGLLQRQVHRRISGRSGGPMRQLPEGLWLSRGFVHQLSTACSTRKTLMATLQSTSGSNAKYTRPETSAPELPFDGLFFDPNHDGLVKYGPISISGCG